VKILSQCHDELFEPIQYNNIFRDWSHSTYFRHILDQLILFKF